MTGKSFSKNDFKSIFETKTTVPLTFEKILSEGFKSPEEWPELLGIDPECYLDNLTDFVFGEFSTRSGEFYKVIHGFPGDNPHGIFFNKTLVGEGMESSNHPVVEWYLENTQNCVDYSDPCWTAVPQYPNKQYI